MYLQVVLDNGAGTVSSNEVNVRTLDGGESFPDFTQIIILLNIQVLTPTTDDISYKH